MMKGSFPEAPRLGKSKREGEAPRQLEARRQNYEQRERHFQLLQQHKKEKFAVRQEEAAQSRREPREFQQGILTLLTQLVRVLGSRTALSSPPLD